MTRQRPQEQDQTIDDKRREEKILSQDLKISISVEGITDLPM